MATDTDLPHQQTGMWLAAAYGKLLPNTIIKQPPTNRSSSIKAVINGYGQLVQAKVKDGWSCTQLTFMFKAIPGSREGQVLKMKDDVNWVYSTFLTRVIRRPNSLPTDRLPVFKRDKAKKQLVPTNGGLHFNGLLLVPETTRLTCPVPAHFSGNQQTYVQPSRSIDRIHAQIVTYSHRRITDYVLKTIGNGLISYDDGILLLPRSASEMTSSTL
jgi:hypothetical protein